MALDELFSFATSQIATIASIIVIVVAAVKGINKSQESRLDRLKHELLESIANIREDMNTMRQYIERDLQRHERSLERLSEEKRDKTTRYDS